MRKALTGNPDTCEFEQMDPDWKRGCLRGCRAPLLFGSIAPGGSRTKGATAIADRDWCYLPAIYWLAQRHLVGSRQLKLMRAAVHQEASGSAASFASSRYPIPRTVVIRSPPSFFRKYPT
jgi:hypothetical protein